MPVPSYKAFKNGGACLYNCVPRNCTIPFIYTNYIIPITQRRTVCSSIVSGGGTTPPTGKTYTVGSVQFTMKGIAAVTNGIVGHSDESDNEPHTVSLTAYRIGETEVTQELWQKVMGTNPSFFDNTGNKMFNSDPYDTNITSGEVQEKRPVENVTWYQCIAFCNKLTKKVPELGESQYVYTYNGNTYNSTDARTQR